MAESRAGWVSSKMKEARFQESREQEVGGNIPVDWVINRRFRVVTVSPLQPRVGMLSTSPFRMRLLR
jgi:hypothetical protein